MSIIPLTYKQRLKRHLEGVELNPKIQSTIDFINDHIKSQIAANAHLNKKELVENIKTDPFMKWIVKGHLFTTPLVTNLIMNLSYQIKAIEEAKTLFPEIYAPIDDVDTTIYIPTTWGLFTNHEQLLLKLKK